MNVNGRKAILLQKLPYEMIKAAFDTYHTDMTDNGYIAVLEGTEKKEELEEGIGLTGGFEETIPEAVNLHYFGSEKWCRVLVIYNDSYAMILWIKGYDGFDSYADETV